MKEELLSNRLWLVPVENQDRDLIFQLLRNDKIKKYLCDNKDVKIEFVESMIISSNRLFEEKGIGLWLVKEAGKNSTIGICGFMTSNLLELIYVIHPEFQNNGFATEAVLRVIEYFKELEIKDEIFAKIDYPNFESHQVAIKIGMKEVGTEKNQVTGGDMKLYQLKRGGDT